MYVSALDQLQLNQRDQKGIEMSTFVLESDNRIRALAPGEPVPETDPPEKFKTLDELTALSESWPMTRLVAIWDTLPGVTPVKKFTDRKTAITRIWKAIQGLVSPTSEAAAD